MKKIFLLLLSLAILTSAMALMTACGGNDPEVCDEHTDADENRVCDVCGEVIPKKDEEVVEATVTFTVKDLDELILAGITVTLQNASDDNATGIDGISGTDGKFTLKLKPGTYRVSYAYNSDEIGYYLPETHSVTVTKDTVALDLYLVNNNPNGTEERPFAISVEETEITIPASTSYYYIVYRAVNLYMDIEGAGIKVSYDGKVYTPDAENKISFKLNGEDTNSVEMLLFENTTDTDATYTVAVNAAPGTSGNPHIIQALGEAITTGTITSDVIVYYSYTATEAGVFTITVSGEGSYVSMINARNSVTVNSNDADDGVISIEVQAGDEIIIDCSTSSADDEGTEVIFIPNLNVPTAW